MKTSPDKTASAWAVLRVYFKAALQYPWLFGISTTGLLIMQIANIVAPLYLKQIFNVLASQSPSPEVVRALVTLVGVIGLWWLIRAAAERVEHFCGLRVIIGAIRDLSSRAFSYLIDHSHHFFISRFSGSLTQDVNKFAKSFQAMYEVFMLSFLPTAFFAAGAVFVLFTRHYALGLMLGAWVIIFFAFQVWVSYLRQPLRRAYAVADSRVAATLADAISNQATVTLFAAGDHERAVFKAAEKEWYRTAFRSWQADVWIWGGVGAFMIAIEIGLLYGAVLLWEQGILTVGDFVLIQAYLLVLFERLVAIQNNIKRVFSSVADAGEMVAIMEMPYEVQDIPQAKLLGVSTGTITLTDVNFYFNQTNPVLEKFNLAIRGGERVALVGPSGAGKSTITKLLLRLYDVAGGEITIDGQNIAKVTQDSLRNAIAFVPQEPVLFHRTLMENIRYGRREATDEEVFEAAKQAHCHEFIEKLPLKYDTLVGERGVKLSGGERQRVAIARAILKNAPILILDEATSSLDSESESLIQDALKVLMQAKAFGATESSPDASRSDAFRGKTVIVIAHRLSTIMQMDRIVVIDGGTIVAEGTHDELLAQGGLYKKLWSIQAGGFLQDN